MSVISVGEDLVNQQHFGAKSIQNRLDETLGMWKHLLDLTAYRRKRLEEAVDFHQVRIVIVDVVCDMRRLKRVVFSSSRTLTMSIYGCWILCDWSHPRM